MPTAKITKLKFIYSEKATKFCEIFPLLLNTVHTVKSKGKISQNFVVFSEYMNFTTVRKSCNILRWCNSLKWIPDMLQLLGIWIRYTSLGAPGDIPKIKAISLKRRGCEWMNCEQSKIIVYICRNADRSWWYLGIEVRGDYTA